jgi:hypothetical protein
MSASTTFCFPLGRAGGAPLLFTDSDIVVYASELNLNTVEINNMTFSISV